jgi:prefoldin subunit 5
MDVERTMEFIRNKSAANARRWYRLQRSLNKMVRQAKQMEREMQRNLPRRRR